MAISIHVDFLSNPLVTIAQLEKHRARSSQETASAYFAQALLVQSAGILLRLPQEVIATAIVLLQRHNVNSSNADSSLSTNASAVLYLAAKLSFTPLSPRSIINVFTYLSSKSVSPLRFINPTGLPDDPDQREYYVSEGTYERERQKLFAAETKILTSLGFDTRVSLPHAIALTYLQALGASSPHLCQRVIQHLNGGLLSPQMPYLTHHTNALAVAAIYLAAREEGVKLVDQNWWEVFDVDREDLGFLVLAFGSFPGFAAAEHERWKSETIVLD